MQNYIDKSVNFVDEDPCYKKIIQDWINFGDSINSSLFRGIKLSSKYQELFNNTKLLMENSNIYTEEELVLLRETSYAERLCPSFTSVSHRERNLFCGTFGDNVYDIIIPKGTRIFYISALDYMNKRESEEEFLLDIGNTKLENSKLVYLSV